MDEIIPDNLTSSMVDHVFFVLQKSIEVKIKFFS